MNKRGLDRSAFAPNTRTAVLAALLLASTVLLHGQGVASYQDDFPAGEFVARRNQVFDAIGPQAILIQGAPGVDGFKVFRLRWRDLALAKTPKICWLKVSRSIS